MGSTWGSSRTSGGFDRGGLVPADSTREDGASLTRLIDSQRFGSRSEKIPPEQGRLFNEAEIEECQEVPLSREDMKHRFSARPTKKKLVGAVRHHTSEVAFRGVGVGSRFPGVFSP